MISTPDVQSQRPSVEISLSRVGVTGVEKVIRIRQNGSEQLFHARLECYVDLGPDQKGAHMSRFEEVVNDAIGEVILGEATFRAETLAQHVAELVRERQGARRAEVTLAARFPEHKPAPVSGITTQEMYTLFGSAVASALETKMEIWLPARRLALRRSEVLRSKARLVDGKVEMEVNYGLEPDEVEAGFILTCQSHPRSEKVVVDYDVK